MATVHFATTLSLDTEGTVWSASNGATRRKLQIINKLPAGSGQVKTIDCQVGTLDKGNHSFIFLNPAKPEDKRILGVYTNTSYGYSVVEGTEIYGNYSSGGPGNSCSQFGIYEVGTILKIATYKNRRPPYYVKFEKTGWVEVPSHEIEIEEQSEI